ncbi:mechanosensitive ion channel family protein [Oscillatoria acuminata]|uniref:Small-conductance mechanosensitive channel n=1 Tax=Oscillatoria acuminata PCC 6304 TaxID=56110 RepID=K9TM87_9CYAN|nr:mechanosensitive ion channel family protein [Oscillatoria acuminata]AFY83129.1 small-conductance mechanosensitive channel [Oscillatoria acuminata PCC 6304]
MDIQKSQDIKPARTGRLPLVGGKIAKRTGQWMAIAALQVLSLQVSPVPAAIGQIPPQQSNPEASTDESETTDTAAESPPQSSTTAALLSLSPNNWLSEDWFSQYLNRPVRLDGRTLFPVAPIELSEGSRVEAIERQLQQLLEAVETELQQNRQTQNPDGTYSSDEINTFINQNLQIYNNPLGGLPVIYARWGRGETQQIRLLTVTQVDADRLGMPLEMVADRWQQQIRQGLLRALLERQPDYLEKQVVWSVSIGLAIVLSSLLLFYYQKQFKRKRDQILATSYLTPLERTPVPLREVEHSEDSVPVAESESIEMQQQAESMRELQYKMNKQQQLNVNDIQRRLAQFGQVVIWGGGTYSILGLFPMSRGIQVLILSLLPVPLRLFGVVLSTYVGVRLSAIAIDRFFSVLQEGKLVDLNASRRLALRFSTFSGVFKSLTAAGCVSIGILMTLSVIGLDIAPILAGAGIIGLGISLASQSLIKDTINGFLILFEDQYAIGDVILVDDVGGLVENMNLRITQLRNGEGQLITIPNSAISIVRNLSKEWARVDLTIIVAYQNNVDRVLQVLQELSLEIYSEPEWQEKMIDAPEVLGIDQIDYSGILIRIWIKTKPLQHWSVAREFRRRMKTRLDQHGIAIGVPQQSVVFQSSLELLKQARNSNGDRSPKILMGNSDQASS